MTKRLLTRVREVRRARGLSQADLARLAGMEPQTLSKIEIGATKDVSPDARRKLAPILGVAEDQLLRPVGFPIPPLDGEPVPGETVILQAILDELKELNKSQQEMLAALKEMVKLLKSFVVRC